MKKTRGFTPLPEVGQSLVLESKLFQKQRNKPKSWIPKITRSAFTHDSGCLKSESDTFSSYLKQNFQLVGHNVKIRERLSTSGPDLAFLAYTIRAVDSVDISEQSCSFFVSRSRDRERTFDQLPKLLE